MSPRIFVYGTLLVPEVMQAVTGRSLPTENAVLHDYARYKIRHQVFPGIIESRGDHVQGLAVGPVDTDTLQRLDRFESRIYERRNVTICLDAGRQETACAYVVTAEYADLLTDEPWDPGTFSRRDLPEYLNRIGGPR